MTAVCGSDPMTTTTIGGSKDGDREHTMDRGSRSYGISAESEVEVR
ncbi:formin-like protein 3 isoform X1 [Iris pallida]|uniref:Formin-like protein 3 isoform X1 n=1 Tax=Iris pallida TaxID=29817 RepID=A0AAX6E6T7_IRIPA|nr:formin-like protein 3 isoform X1 [Iris pallida]